MKIILFQFYICREIVKTFRKGLLGHKHISQEIIPDQVQCYMEIYKHGTSYNNYLNYEELSEDIKLLWQESKKSSLCNFSKLPVKYYKKSIFHSINLL